MWVLAGMMALYGIDKVEANRLEETLRDVRGKTDSRGGLSRQLDIGRFLESAGPAPLEVLDRTSEAMPDKALLSFWSYARPGGAVNLRGTVKKEKDIRDLLANLRQAGEVQLMAGKPDKQNFRFDLALSIGQSLGPPDTRPATRPVTSSETKPTSSPASQPATAPSSPGSDPGSSPPSALTAVSRPGGAL